MNSYDSFVRSSVRTSSRKLFGCTTVLAFGLAACQDAVPSSDLAPPDLAEQQSALTPGTWSTVAALYPNGSTPAVLQLLMDGSVLVQDSDNGLHWHRLIASAIGGYTNGSWQTAASSINARAAFATGLLRDGRFVVGGGEYVDIANCTTNSDCVARFGTGHVCTNFAPGVNMCVNPNGRVDGRSKMEIYDPAVNYPAGQWQSLPDLPNLDLADGDLAPLPNGKLLFGAAYGTTGAFNTQSIEFDPTNLTNPWSTTLHATGGPAFTEGSMTLLQTGDIFLSENGAARYSTSSQSWTNIPLPPGYNNPFGAVPGSIEGGPVLTLYDGTVMIAGATGFNGKYTPSTNTLANIANTPGGGRMDENDQVVLPTGNVLCGVTDHAHMQPYTFYEYSPTANTFTSVMTGAPANLGGELIQTPLPDGTVLVASSTSSTFYIYRPQGAQVTSFGQPTISNVTGPVAGVYTLTGTTLNGLTNGANRDDEGQNYTSFPIIAVTTPGETEYVRVTSVSTASIAPGASATVTFTLPNDAPHGPVQLTLSASGLFASNTWSLSNGVALAGPGQQYVAFLN